MNKKFKNFYLESLIFSIFILVLLLGRIDLLYFYNILNPDEGQFIANAMRMTNYGINFDSTYSGSSGPLNIIILLWPKLFGLDINVGTTRLTDFIILLFSAYLLYKILELYCTKFLSLLLTLPFVLFYTFSIHEDFLHYSGERFPVLLLLLSLYFISKFIKEKFSQIYLIGFLLGLIPYSKIQAGPIAFIIGLFLLVVIYYKYENKFKIRLLILTVLFSLIPSLLFLIPLYLNGNFLEFYYGYLSSGVDYIFKPLSIGGILFLIQKDNQFFDIFICFFVLLLLFSYMFYIFSIYKNNYKNNWILAFYTLVLFITSYSIILPGRTFFHYLNLLIPFLILLTDFLLIQVLNHFKLLNNLYIKIFMSICLFSLSYNLYNNYEGNRNFSKLDKSEKIFYERDLFSWLEVKKNEELLNWGWMCQFYSDTNLISATREPLPFSFMYNVKNRKYFLEQYLKDFKKSEPNYIIDAVTPYSFNFNNVKKQSIKSFANLNDLVEKDYKLITQKDKYLECPRIYLKNEKFSEIDNKLIKIDKIYTKNRNNIKSINNINDSSVFEICKDYWVLPKNEFDTIFIELKANEKIAKTLILNTKNGDSANKASKSILIEFYNNENIIFSKKVELNRYPNWTKIDSLGIKNKDVNKILIKILSFYGEGAGLNEIKFYK